MSIPNIITSRGIYTRKKKSIKTQKFYKKKTFLYDFYLNILKKKTL